jgi:RNA polymerase sigma-70 factor (ECF subfamily)
VLVLTAGFGWDEWPDLQQELILDLLQRAKHFNPALSDWWAFVRGVMRHRATVLANRRRRLTEREVFLEDLAPHERQRADTRLRSQNPKDELENRVDVGGIVANLPPRIKEIVALLPDCSIPEICEKTGRSRSQVYRTLREARSSFTRSGFHSSKNRSFRR